MRITRGDFLFVGVDCGLKGAVTFYDPDDKIDGLQIFDMPIKPSYSKNKKTIDGVRLSKIFDYFHPFIYHPIYFEQPHALPRDGAAGAFSFGEGVGIVKGVIESLGLHYIPIVPAVWKARMGLTKDKKESVEMAKHIFSLHKNANDILLKSKDGRAESALLAFLACQTFGKGVHNEKS